MSYNITGTFKGRRYYRSFSSMDYDFALKVFQVNEFTSLWLVFEDGTRKLLMRKK